MHAVRNEMSEYEEREGRIVPDRRESRVSWTDPRVVTTIIFGLAGVVFSLLTLAGFIVGIYVVMQTKSATTEVSTSVLAAEMSKMNDKLDALSDDVKSGTKDVIEMKSQTVQNTRDIERESNERKGSDGEHHARFVVLEQKVAGLQARQ